MPSTYTDVCPHVAGALRLCSRNYFQIVEKQSSVLRVRFRNAQQVPSSEMCTDASAQLALRPAMTGAQLKKAHESLMQRAHQIKLNGTMTDGYILDRRALEVGLGLVTHAPLCRCILLA